MEVKQAEKEVKTTKDDSKPAVALRSAELKRLGKREGWLIQSDEIELSEKPFASGACACVFKGDFRGYEVCVKRVKDRSKSVMIEDMQKEIKIWSRLRHPNIVQFLGAVFDPKHGEQIVLQLLGGGDLLEKLKDGSLSRRKAKSVAISIAQALAYLHGNKPCPILHRDMKPANIFFDAHGKAKLSDFGLSRHKPEAKGQYEMTGKTGTMRYMAPELLCEEKYDESVDIYALGLIVFYMFTKSPPFSGYNREARIAYGKKKKDFRVLPCHNLSDEIKLIVEATTQADPKLRPSAKKIIKELKLTKRERSARLKTLKTVPRAVSGKYGESAPLFVEEMSKVGTLRRASRVSSITCANDSNSEEEEKVICKNAIRDQTVKK